MQSNVENSEKIVERADFTDVQKLVARAIARFKITDINPSEESIIQRYIDDNRISAELGKALVESLKSPGKSIANKILEYRKQPANNLQIDFILKEIERQKKYFNDLQAHPVLKKNLEKLVAQNKKLLAPNVTPAQFFTAARIYSYYHCADFWVSNPDSMVRLEEDVRNDNNQVESSPVFPSLKTLTMQRLLSKNKRLLQAPSHNVVSKEASSHKILQNFLENMAFTKQQIEGKPSENGKFELSKTDIQNQLFILYQRLDAKSQQFFKEVLNYENVYLSSVFVGVLECTLFSSKEEMVVLGDKDRSRLAEFIKTFLMFSTDTQKEIALLDREVKYYLTLIPLEYLEELTSVLGMLKIADLQVEFCKVFATTKSLTSFSAMYQSVVRKYRWDNQFLVNSAFLWGIATCDSFTDVPVEIYDDFLLILLSAGDEALLESFFELDESTLPNHPRVTKAGVDTQVKGETFLLLALRNHNLVAVNYLLEKRNAKANVPSSNAITYPLHYVARYGRVEDVKLLLSRDDSAKTAFSNEGVSVLCYAAQGNSSMVVDLLVEADAGIENLVTNRNDSPPNAIHWAIKNKNLQIFYKLLDYAFKKNCLSEMINSQSKGGTPLHWAVRDGRVEEARWFLSREDSTKNVLTDEGLSAVCCAAQANNLEMVVLLIKAGAQIENLETYIKDRPLNAIHWAIKNRNLQVLCQLLDYAHKQNSLEKIINKTSKEGTPLKLVYASGLKEFAKILIQYGVGIPNDGSDIAQWAVKLLKEMKNESEAIASVFPVSEVEHIPATSVVAMSGNISKAGKRALLKIYAKRVVLYSFLITLFSAVAAPVIFGLLAGLVFGFSPNEILAIAVPMFLGGLGVGGGGCLVWSLLFPESVSLSVTAPRIAEPDEDLDAGRDLELGIKNENLEQDVEFSNKSSNNNPDTSEMRDLNNNNSEVEISGGSQTRTLKQLQTASQRIEAMRPRIIEMNKNLEKQEQPATAFFNLDNQRKSDSDQDSPNSEINEGTSNNNAI
jgi:hypothetical protein